MKLLVHPVETGQAQSELPGNVGYRYTVGFPPRPPGGVSSRLAREEEGLTQRGKRPSGRHGSL